MNNTYTYKAKRIDYKDNCGFIEVDRNTIEPFIDQKQAVLLDVITELTYLTDATTNEELAALCDACDYDYDTLSEWNKECKALMPGNRKYSNFTRALVESNYDNNALIDYAKKYKEFMNKPPV